MPRSKKQNNVEETKSQSAEVIEETKKVVHKKPLLEKKVKTIKRSIIENNNVNLNSESDSNNIEQKELNNDKLILDVQVNSNQNKTETFNQNFDGQLKEVNNEKKLLSKTSKNSSSNKKVINPKKLKSEPIPIILNSNIEIDSDNINNIEKINEENSTHYNSDLISKGSKIINEDIKLKKVKSKQANSKNIKFNSKQEIKSDIFITEEIIPKKPEISEKTEDETGFIKTENKYYNFQAKVKNKNKKNPDNLAKDNNFKEQKIENQINLISDSEQINSIVEASAIEKPLDINQDKKVDIPVELSTQEKKDSLDSTKNEKSAPKTHEERLKEKNERIERARILNRMNQLKQNEERRLLKLQNQGKINSESVVNIEQTNADISPVKNSEQIIKNPENNQPEKIEKISTEKPIQKSDEEKLREKNERIEQARILNRINQLNRNKEKQLLRLQEAQNKTKEQSKPEKTENLPNPMVVDESAIKAIDNTIIDDNQIKQQTKENLKNFNIKDTSKENIKDQKIVIVNDIENEDVKEIHISKSKENKSKPEHNKKSIKGHIEKPIEELKSKKPIPDLILDYSIINPKKSLTNTQKNDPFLKNFYDKVEDFLKKELFIEKGFKILVAVSGGVDSIVLLDCLAILSNKLFFNIYVAHYNHKLRAESSEKDEKFVAGQTQDYNLQFYVANGNVKSFAEKNSISIEHAARQLRYNFFERTARNLNIDFVATAHTADDSAETFIINLLRGSGLTGLSGIPAKRQFVKNISIVRPFLHFHKKDLFEYAKKRKLVWRQDESNALMNYTRNKIRLDLLPKLENEYNPSIVDTINRTSRLIYGADEIIKDIVKKNITNLIIDAGTDKFSMKISMLQTFSEFLQGEFIQYSWLKYFRLQPLALATIDRILNLFNSQTGAVCEINSQFFALKDRNTLIFSKKIVEEGFKQLVTVPGEITIGKQKIIFKEIDRKDLKYNSDSNIEYFDGKAFEGFIELRTWAEGDTFQPLGMNGEIKISDFLINEKVSLIDKSKILVLTNKMEILWVVGKRISETFKVKKTSKTIIKAEIIKTEKKS